MIAFSNSSYIKSSKISISWIYSESQNVAKAVTVFGHILFTMVVSLFQVKMAKILNAIKNKPSNERLER